MPDIALLCEDSFHEKFVGALFRRFEQEYSVRAVLRPFSSRGGIAQMHGELKYFLRDLERDRQRLPDGVVVVVDANCKGYNQRKALMDRVVAHRPQFKQLVSYAIPDPHIERWMLVDPRGVQTVFHRGCTLPALKCQKDEYKRILRAEIRESGVEPVLRGRRVCRGYCDGDGPQPRRGTIAFTVLEDAPGAVQPLA
jgi:hypothetical protein